MLRRLPRTRSSGVRHEDSPQVGSNRVSTAGTYPVRPPDERHRLTGTIASRRSLRSLPRETPRVSRIRSDGRCHRGAVVASCFEGEARVECRVGAGGDRDCRARPGRCSTPRPSVGPSRPRTTRDVLFADDLLPGVGDEQHDAAPGRRRRRRLHVRHPACCSSRSTSSRPPTLSVLAPNIRDTLRRQRRRRSCSSAPRPARSSCSARCRWAGSPTGSGAAPIIGWATAFFSAHGVLVRPRRQRVHPVLARFGVGIAKSNSFPVQGSLIADTYPIGIRGRVSATIAGAARARRRPQPGPRRRHRRPRRRRRRLALGVLPARHPGDPARHPRLPDPGAATRSVRDARRARRGRRRTASRRRSRSRRRSPGSTGSAPTRRCCSRSRRWASACSPGRCCRTSTSRTTSGSRRSAAAWSAPSTALGVLLRAAVRGQALRRACSAATRRKALRLLGLLIVPGRRSSCRSSTSCRTRCCSPPSASCPASC